MTPSKWLIAVVTVLAMSSCGGDDTGGPSDGDGTPGGTGGGAFCGSPHNQYRRPVAPSVISQKYGGQYPAHSGVDYAGSRGTAVRALAPGKVTTVQRLTTSYGFHVIVSHTCAQTLYAHLSSISVHQGQRVKQGQIVGHRGSTGNSTGPHTHFEVRKGGNTVPPEPWIKNRGPGYGGFEPDQGHDFGENLKPDILQGETESASPSGE